jgi:hypothetical protein
MPKDFPPPGWFLRPESWPHWMPASLPRRAFTLPQLSGDPWDQNPSSQSPSSPNGNPLGNLAQPDDTWDVRTSGWLGPALFPSTGGGLLGNLAQPSDTGSRSTSSLLRPTTPSSAYSGILGDFAPSVDDSWPAIGGIPGKLAHPNDTWDVRTSGWLGSALSPNARGGIHSNLGRPGDSWNSSDPSWLNSAMSPSTNSGIFGSAPLPPAFPHSLPSGSGNTAGLWSTPFGENVGSRNVPALQSPGASSQMYGAQGSASRTEPSGIQLAGMDSPFPGIWPPIPPVVVPGLPEWREHFDRGLQGLINAFKSSGRGRGRRKEDDDDDDECLSRRNAEVARCHERIDDYAHRDFLAACKQRATDRWRLCIQNKGRPDPHEPPEWGPDDEEIWRNYGR